MNPSTALRLLTSCFLLLSSALLLRADREADRRNEKIPPGLQVHAPRHRLISPLGSPGSPVGNGFTPQQLRHAYGFDQLAATGQGQIIAIVDAFGNPSVQADLDIFCAAFNIPSTALDIYYPQGLPPPDSGWAAETNLDVQWAHAIAPGAKIIVVASISNSAADLYAAVDFAVSKGARQISLSWGAPEYFTNASSDYHFNVSGVTFTASSGDSGAGVNYPASSPFVVGIGGTSLSLDATANVSLETAWSGSGGGLSLFEPMPSYQTGWFISTQRGVPDVAYNADPTTGVPVYQTGVGWAQYGGTSISAPQWAALFALANSMRAQPITSAPTAVYSLASANYSGYFRDIVTGSNAIPPNPGYSAGPFYDHVTGLGAPKADQLVLALAGVVSAPVFSPPAGSYSSAQDVTLTSTTPGAFISYTLDGSVPNSSSNGTVYTGPITISSDTTLNAMAYKSGLTDSAVTTGSYTIVIPVAANPTFSPGGGTYTSVQSVSIFSGTAGATIHYTTDGSAPSEVNGTLYSGPVSVGSTMTLHAIAFKTGYSDSPVSSSAYTINLPVAAVPIFSPDTGTYSNAQFVTISSATSGATIRYTTDGSTPTEANGTIYSSAITVSSTTTLKAIAFEAGFVDSPVTTATLTIIGSAPSFTTQPVSQTVILGDSVTFSVTVSGALPLNYQWKLNGRTIRNATAATYAIPVTQSSDAGAYSVTVTNAFGSATSAAATLTVNVPPTIKSQPASKSVRLGSSVTFKVSVNGTSPLNYQWAFNGSPINGATAASYSIGSVQASDAGNYTVAVINVAGSAISNAATLMVK